MKIAEIEKILVPVDFSVQTMPVFETAVQIARRHQSEITLLHIIEPSSDFYYPDPVMNVIERNEMQKELIEKMESIVRESGQRGSIRVKNIILFGVATDKIIRTAEKGSFHLIVMGTHGGSGFREFFIGSTAYRVIKHSHCPVLTIPGNKKENFEKILLPVRLIPHALDKYEYVRNIVKQNRSELIVMGLISSKQPEDGTEGLTQQLNNFTDRLNSDNIQNRTSIIHSDNFASDVLKQAKEMNVDLIVPTANLDFVMRDFFVGPFVQQIINHSEVPVLSIRPDLTMQQNAIRRETGNDAYNILRSIVATAQIVPAI